MIFEPLILLTPIFIRLLYNVSNLGYFYNITQVDKLKADVNEQKSKVTTEEEEVETKKKELDQIRSEESLLQAKLANLKRDIDSLSNVSGQMQLQISQAKAILVSLEEFQSRLKEGTTELETAITNNDIHKLNTLIARPLTPPPELKTAVGLTRQ